MENNVDIILETERLILRDIREEDFPAIHQYGSDPEVVKFMLFGPNTEADTKAFIGRTLAQQKAQPRTHYNFALINKKDNRLIGACEVGIDDMKNKEGMVGYILNRKYWKLPIVYGGFLGCAYAVSWNSGMYQTYLNAYRDITDTDPATASYLLLIPKGRTIDSFGGTDAFKSILNTKQENYRRYRDLSIIATVAYYALTIVDAFVDAQLYDFDISPDLSMRVQPTLLKNDFGVPNTLGMQCSISLR